MNDYKQVSDALASGADPAMLCATCPWNRTCIEPPQMSRDEVEAKTAPPTTPPPNDRKEGDSELFKGLLNVMLFSGKDTSAQVCPVFAMRLQSSDGRDVVDTIRDAMVKIATRDGAEVTS